MSAVTITWLFNRSFTFAADRPREHTLLGEWLRYVVSQLGGFGVNYAVYAVLVSASMLVLQWPVLGVAAGSVAGLVANYLLAKRYVFGGQKLGE
jgi:putative flippase GtrA